MRLSVSYPPLSRGRDADQGRRGEPPLDSLEPVSTATELVAAAEQAKRIYVEESLKRYVVALLRTTRADSRLYLGASPRAGIAASGRQGAKTPRTVATLDDVKAVAEVVLSHRLILAPEARSAGLSADELVRDAVAKTPVPV